MASNPWIKTIALVAAAGVTTALAVATHQPPKRSAAAAGSDQGTPLAPELTDPQKVTSLEVISWDEQEARPRAFKVEWKDNRWIIPSAYNYPVDATQNMAAAASSFVGMLKERIVTDQASEFAKYGLVAPDDVASTATAGRGTRVTMRDATGKTVADLIIGGPVMDDSTAAGAPPSKRYVREAGKNRVYTTTLNQTYSTRLADWVQTDLLKVTADQIRTIGIERYRINEQNGTLTDLTNLVLTRPDGPPPAPQQDAPPIRNWTLAASSGSTQLAPVAAPVNQSRMDDMLTSLTTLRIVGVRPKPPNVAAIMAGDKSEGKIVVSDQASLQRHGFFLTGNGVLVANEGSMTLQCTDGVVYTLWIGELATDEATKDQAAGSAATDTKTKNPDGRYMMVTVSFDEKALGAAPVKPAELDNLEKQAAAATADKPLSDDAKARLANLGAEFKARSDGFNRRMQAGKERQAALAKRFAAWYYVVDATSLSKIRPTKDELLSAQTPAPAPTPPVNIPTTGN